MEKKYYLVVVKITSQDTEDRTLTPYDNEETAIRKYHEAFGSVGAGSKKIKALLLDSEFGILKREIWTQSVEQTPEETPTE